MKKIVTAIVCLMLTLSAAAENKIIVWQKDGTVSEFTFDSQPKISYEGNSLVVKTNKNQVSFPLMKIRKVSFEYEPDPLAIEEQKVSASFRFTGDMVEVSNARPGEVLHIYHSNGTLVATHTVGNDGNMQFSTASMETGVYLVRIGSITYKIWKR